MEISKHFTLQEFVTSQTAISNRIGNMPDDKQLKAIVALTEKVLEPARTALGMPIHISSGFRSARLNELIKGRALNSQHMKGEAADLQCANNAALFKYIKENLTYDQLIWEFGDDNQPAWVHVSYTENGLNRFQVLRASEGENGKTKYHAFV